MPDDPKNPDSLGDDRTFTGDREVPQEEQWSLGDQATAGDALSSISDLDDPGDSLDFDLPLIDLSAHYKIERELGKGGMGAVQLATDRSLQRQVAIKRIHASSPAALRRFVTEARSIAALSHFNIVQVYEFERDEEGPFLVMEYVSGGSLLDRLKDGKLEVEDAMDITCQVCDALTLAHRKGIIHRDIKPANILLTEEGVPKLSDFGLAIQKEADNRQTRSGIWMGTLYYMAPEQRQDASAADARSDLWSLAATLYQMLTGKTPDVIRLNQLPANLVPIIGKMLEEDPGERYQTAGEFKAELRKGMATAVTPVAVDLIAGVCPSCNATSNSNQKFCHKCAEPLVVPCLSCSKEIAVWHNACGQCGCKQDEQRDQIREKMAEMIEECLALAQGHEYEKALAQLDVVQEDSHAFTTDLYQKAAGQVTSITAERDRQYQLRDQRVNRANQHQQERNCTAVIDELEKIPPPLRRGNQIAEQLSSAQAARDSLAGWLQEIDNDFENKRLDDLLEKTTHFLTLSPADSRVQKLHAQLLQDQERAKAQESKAIGAIRNGEYIKAIELLKTIPEEWQNKRIRDLLTQSRNTFTDGNEAQISNGLLGTRQVRYPCPHCAVGLINPCEQIGSLDVCPTCKGEFVVPDEGIRPITSWFYGSTMSRLWAHMLGRPHLPEMDPGEPYQTAGQLGREFRKGRARVVGFLVWIVAPVLGILLVIKLLFGL